MASSEEDAEDFSKNGMQTRVWGPAGWVFLHCIAQNYPQSPTPEQKELSEARWNICVQCDEYRENNKDKGAPFCNTCGCPLNKKIFTNKFNECPLKKWEDVDTLLFPATQKTKKSLL